MYETIIIGAGPAGITAAIYAARKRMNFLIISTNIGGQTALSGDVENYTGFQIMTGPELTMKFEEHMKNVNVKVNEGESVKSVEKIKGGFKIVTDKASYDTKTVVIASGKKPKLLNVPGEDKYKGKGLTYCATCDGPLFAGKDVAVIGGGNSGLDAVMQMMKIANKTYLINNQPDLTGDKILQEKIKADPGVEIINNANVKEIVGEKFLDGMKVEQNGEEKNLSVKGIFVEIGLVPNTDFISIVKKDKKGEIEIDCTCKTSVPGIFAAGDVTYLPDKQIVIAAGDGAKALLGVYRYLSHRKEG